MLKKYLFHIAAILAIVVLYMMYRQREKDYGKLRQANYALSIQLREVQEKNGEMMQAMQQMTSRQQAAPEEQGTFIDQKKYYRVNWRSYIHISVNNYSTGFLGGIRGLKFIVNNGTDFPLDNVMIGLQYLKANGEVFKTETVNVDAVPANSSRAAAAPDSRRGVKVKWELQRITSQEMNFCYSKDKTVNAGDADPYQCIPAAAQPGQAGSPGR